MPASTVILSREPIEHATHIFGRPERRGPIGNPKARKVATPKHVMVPVYRGMDRATLKCIQAAAKYAAKRKAKAGTLAKVRKAFAP